MKNNKFKLFNKYLFNIKPFGILYSVFLLLCHLTIVSILDSLAFKVLNYFILDENPFFEICIILINFLTTLISIFILTYLSIDTAEKKINQSKITYKDYIYLFLITLCFRFIYDNTLFPLSCKIFLNTNSLINKYSLFIFFNSSLIAPLIEELFYRGLLLNGLSKKYSTIKALLVSSLLFALMHSNLVQDINAFIFSLFIGYVFIYTSSLKLSIFIHASNNLIVSLFTASLLINNIPLLILALSITIIFIIFLFNKLNLKNREKLCIKNNDNINFHL